MQVNCQISKNNFFGWNRRSRKVPHSEKKVPWLKVQAYRINEIWSIDVAYMDKTAKYNNGLKYLLVAVNVFRFLSWTHENQNCDR